MHSSSSGRRRSATSLQEALLLREAERDDVALDADRAAGGDQRLHGAVALGDRRDDRRPAAAEALEVVAGGGVRRRRRARGGRRRRPGSATGAARAARRRLSAARRRVAGAPARRRRRGASGAGVRRRRGRRGVERGLGGGARVARGRAARRRARGRAPRRRMRPARGASPRRGGAAGAGSNRASSSWSRRPPGPSRVGSMAASRRAAAATPGSVAGPRGEAGEQPLAEGVDDLVEEHAQVAAALLEPVEQLDARRGVAGRERRRRTRRRGRRRRGRAGRGRHRPRCGPPVEASSWSRIDSASRIPPAARRATSAIASGSASPAVGRQDPLELAADLGDGAAAGRRTAGAATGSPAGSPAGWVDANMNVTKSGGSSSDLRSAFQASFVIWCASSRM